VAVAVAGHRGSRATRAEVVALVEAQLSRSPCERAAWPRSSATATLATTITAAAAGLAGATVVRAMLATAVGAQQSPETPTAAVASVRQRPEEPPGQRVSRVGLAVPVVVGRMTATTVVPRTERLEAEEEEETLEAGALRPALPLLELHRRRAGRCQAPPF